MLIKLEMSGGPSFFARNEFRPILRTTLASWYVHKISLIVRAIALPRKANAGNQDMKRAVESRAVMSALLFTILSLLVVIGMLLALGPDWSKFAPATCTATHCFCELPRVGHLMLQPANSVSSFGYVLIGFLMVSLARVRDTVSALSPLAMQTLGVTSIIVGLGSALLHATLTLWGQFFDVLGMYLIGSFFLVRALTRWRNIPDGRATAFYIGLSGMLVLLLIMLPEIRRWLFAVLLIVAIIVELVFARPLRPGARLTYYLGGLFVTALAFGIWMLDQQHIICVPESLLQGHAIWHILGAASLWLTFCYYRSER